jgi:tetratricopeptide (TPR) repeat protein
MFPPEWPKMSETRKLLTRANTLIEESPNDRAQQDRALELYQQALAVQDSRLVWRNIGLVHFNREEWDAAELAFRSAHDHFWLGLLYEWTGRLEMAWSEIRRAKPSPDQARVLGRVARQLGRTDEGIRALKKWDDVDSLFELAHLYDQHGDIKHAWSTSERANAQKGQRDLEPFPELNYKVRPENRPEEPIFIIGMPRSGTTLIERMLAQHPNVESKGESLFFEFISDKLEAGEHITNIGAAYLMGNSARTIDKFPMNFRYIDLIEGVFPKARLIDMRRNRNDTLISCWFRNFQGRLPWSYHWDDLHAAYDRYLEEMDSRNVYRLDYEKLVEDPENVLRAVLDYCHLEWDERCLNHNADPTFHKYAYDDVRRPVTKDRIGSALRYGQYLPKARTMSASA